MLEKEFREADLTTVEASRKSRGTMCATFMYTGYAVIIASDDRLTVTDIAPQS